MYACTHICRELSLANFCQGISAREGKKKKREGEELPCLYTYLQSGARHARWPLPVDGIERSVTSPGEWFPYPISLFNEHHARVKKEKNYIYNLVYVRRTSCCKKRIDRVKKVYKHELQSSIDTVFSTAPAFFQLFILIANIFYAVCLLVQSRHAEGTRFSFSRSFARNYHPFLSREEN